MENQNIAETTASVKEAASSHETGFMSPEITLIILTWVTFFAVLAILHKFAWKPILAALDAREDMIRKAVEDADKAKEELNRINETRHKLITEAEVKAKEIIEQSRKAAVEAAKTIEQKTREEAKIMLQNAQREIHEEVEKAQAKLRRESAEIVVDLASKLIQENLDNEKNRKLVDRFIKEI